MSKFLNMWWHEGTFIGEIFSTFLLTFGVIIILMRDDKKFTKSFMIGMWAGITGLMGASLNNLIDPSAFHNFNIIANVFIQSFYYDKYNLILIVVAGQIIGTLIGLLFSLGYFWSTDSLNMVINKKLFYSLTRSNVGKYGLKEIIIQIIFVSSLWALETIGHLAFDPTAFSDVFSKTILVGFFVSSIMYMTSNIKYFLFSPALKIALILINPRGVKNSLLTFAIDLPIHLLVTTIVSLIMVGLKVNIEV